MPQEAPNSLSWTQKSSSRFVLRLAEYLQVEVFQLGNYVDIRTEKVVETWKVRTNSTVLPGSYASSEEAKTFAETMMKLDLERMSEQMQGM